MMGFDLKRLKQLYGMILEIFLANNMSIWDPVTKFLNDIENQYDNKLGFETKIKELSAKKVELESEIPQYKSNLLIQSQMAPLMLHLKNNDVSNEDIINMSQLVISLQNSNFLTNTLVKGGNTANDIGNNNNEKNSKSKSWKSLINKLRSIENLDSEIEELYIHRNKLESEIDLLKFEKSKIEEPNQDSYLV